MVILTRMTNCLQVLCRVSVWGWGHHDPAAGCVAVEAMRLDSCETIFMCR